MFKNHCSKTVPDNKEAIKVSLEEPGALPFSPLLGNYTRFFIHKTCDIKSSNYIMTTEFGVVSLNLIMIS